MKFLLLFIFSIAAVSAQDCSFSLTGKVSELSTEYSMQNVYVTIKETNQKTLTNEEGEFSFFNLCPGEYHITASHVGCEDSVTYCKVNQNRSLDIKLKHFSELLSEAVVHGKELKSIQENNVVTNKTIKENVNKSFGDLLSDVEGVSSLKIGNAVSKPIIHGLTGSRVGFIDSGVPLASQQWGVDHAPEIDPTKADHISVVKGVAALEYATSANALVVVEPHVIKKEPHLHGEASYIYDTNSRGSTANVSFENYNKIVSFFVSGTLKRSGDARAPDYFLTNTGSSQQNVSLLLEKNIGKKIKLKANYSYYNTESGIFSGAFADTEEDLIRSFTAEVPNNINDSFSYDINSPKQEVSHNFLKLLGSYEFSNVSKLNFEYSFQKNQRAEFDVRRTEELTNTPELDLELESRYISSVFSTKFSGNDNFKTGIQYTETLNRNIFGTGTTPLIPDSNSEKIGVFATYTSQINKLTYEFGARLNFSDFNVATAISQEREVRRFSYDYTNYGVTAGVTYAFSRGLKTAFNVGYSTRGADTNELFSFGVHQGNARFERGSVFGNEETFLEEERNFKTTWSWDYRIGNKLFLQTLPYINFIDNYIYIASENNNRLTLRGTFPTFAYTQTDALITGNDFKLLYSPTDQLKFTFKYAYIYGKDLTFDRALVFIPANNGSITTSYNLKDLKHFKNTNLGLTVSHTARQNNFDLEQELVAPPDAYTLLNLSADTVITVDGHSFDFGLKVENLTNTTYRNYLNRLRFFSDERGINLSFRLGYKF